MRTPPTIVGRHAWAVVWALWLLTACGTSIDPVVSGRLCADTRAECPDSATLHRDNPGSNVLDVVIRNTGGRATAVFNVAPPADGSPADAAMTADADLDADAPDAALDGGTADVAGPIVSLPGSVFPQRYTLGPGDEVTDRFPATEVFTPNDLRISLTCRPAEADGDCALEADYVLSTETLQCRSDEDCRGDRLCNGTIGKCVECTSDEQCDRDQSCYEPNGRCLPRKGGGCTTAPHGAPNVPSGLLLAAGLLVLVALLRRSGHRPGRASSGALLLAALLGAAPLAAPSEARADTPVSVLSIGGGPRFVTGNLGGSLHPGFGAEIRETLRSRWVGGTAWIEAAYFLTRQAPPPLTRETTIFGFGIGPRGFIPIGDLEITYGAGYRRVGFAPNTLIRQTGADSNFNAVGGTLGVSYRFDRIELRIDGSFAPIIEVPASLLTINLSIGLASGGER